MCTFYSKKCGIGCVLSTKEFKNFIKRYYERHPDLSENEIKTLNLSITESTFGERSFKRSDGHGFFTFKEIDPEYNDEIKLFPLKQKNKCNQSYINLQKKKHYAILWDMHPNLNISELLNVSFDKNDIKQIQEDFKGALRDYLPEKFRWNKHIGIYSYTWNMVFDQEDW